MSGHFAEWVAGLGPGIANHLWQSTAFAAAAWLLTLALPPKPGACALLCGVAGCIAEVFGSVFAAD